MRILLLGAGFSRNWGGWLASEVMGELCGRLADDPYLLQLLRKTPNFEVVLGKLRQEAMLGTLDATRRFARMEQAIRATFEEMNETFAKIPFEFTSNYYRSIQRYFTNFEAIFTLNQDLLLELQYYPEGNAEHERRWTGYSLPGVVLPPNWRSSNANERVGMTLDVSTDLQLIDGTQPIFKLHGSVNWRKADGSSLLIIGAGKDASIQQDSLLSWYQVKFREHLFAGDTRIMVIGYGFSDTHINEMLMEAASSHGLKMYLVNPAGLSALDLQPAAAVKVTMLRDTIPVVGVSTRPLREIFRSDDLSFNSFQRFLTEG